MSFLVNIAGPSGVGKTTITNLILSVSDYGKSTIISGDDAHKWPRNDLNWQIFTHLNPEANNLQEDYNQLLMLKKGYSIKRSHYNHSNGLFDEPTEISSNNILIYEGLHALYSQQMRDISDLKIYIDTDQDLKIAWKIKRDLNKRGYTENQIYETIKRRMNDETNFILPQKQYADAIVKFTLDESDGVCLEYQLFNDTYVGLFEKIKTFYNLKKQFIKTCKQLSEDEQLVQNKGGNISAKYDNKMLITSSGYELKNVSMFEGLCIVETEHPKNVVFNYGRPSMETMVHSKLGKAVIHTHPVDLLPILCSKNGKSLIKRLYKNYKFDFVPYVAPGNDLYEKIKDCATDIIFCENHGLFVCSDNLQKSFTITKEINKIAKNFITDTAHDTKEHITSRILFPDAVVLKQSNQILNDSVYTKIINCKLKPKFLNKKEIVHILNMEEEKYRSKK
jgi:uridine kinase/ribulose-5-phosphate 4-epimerase/fuculose-1-phosphate aldolase